MADERRRIDTDSPADGALVADILTRRRLIQGLVGAGVSLSLTGLLAACGGGDDDDNDASAGDAADPTTTAQSEKSDTATPASTTEGDDAETRTIAHAFGTTEIPANPQRIVTLGKFSLEALLAIGVQPVGMNLNGTVESQHDYIRDRLDGITPVGTSLAEPDIEKILDLQPDLIIGLSNFFEDRREVLEEIAPIAAFPFESSSQWKETLTFFTDAVGQAAAGEAILEEYEQRLQEVRDLIGEAVVAEIEVSILRVRQDGEMNVYNRPTFIGVVIEDVGFARPESQLIDEFATSISAEQIREADADVLFIWGYDGTSEDDSLNQFLEELGDDPLFGQLTAVQNGHAYVVDGDTWIGSSILAANSVLDDLVEVFARFVPAASSGDEDDASETATRSVETPFGTVAVPSKPERVVALGEEFMLSELLDLGVTPVASTSSLAGGFYALDQFDTSDIERLSNTEPDIERIVALQPDMLITYTGFAESAGIDLLNQLAPTVAIDSSDYRDAYTSIAAAFGLEERAEERLAEYDSTAQEYGDVLGASERTASVATIYPGATDITLWLGGSADLPQALLDMGFALEPNTETLEPTGSLNRAFISLEQVELLTGDDLFMMQSDNIEGETESLEEMTATDLWQRIPAVEADRVHIFDRLGYPGLAGRIRILEDIRETLSE